MSNCVDSYVNMNKPLIMRTITAVNINLWKRQNTIITRKVYLKKTAIINSIQLWRFKFGHSRAKASVYFKPFVRLVCEYSNVAIWVNLVLYRKWLRDWVGINFPFLHSRCEVSAIGLLCRLLDSRGRGTTAALLSSYYHRPTDTFLLFEKFELWSPVIIFTSSLYTTWLYLCGYNFQVS